MKILLDYLQKSVVDPGFPRGRVLTLADFIFMQFSTKKLKNNSTFGNWRTSSGKSWIRHWLTPKVGYQSILFGLIFPENLLENERNWTEKGARP